MMRYFCFVSNSENDDIFLVNFIYIDSVWSEWSTWTRCVPYCGEGTQKRSRMCLATKEECRERPYDQTRDCSDNCSLESGTYFFFFVITKLFVIWENLSPTDGEICAKKLKCSQTEWENGIKFWFSAITFICCLIRIKLLICKIFLKNRKFASIRKHLLELIFSCHFIKELLFWERGGVVSRVRALIRSYFTNMTFISIFRLVYMSLQLCSK